MFDTISAISTPIGEGGIGIIRMSGSIAFNIAETIFISSSGKSLKDSPSHRIYHGFIIDPDTGDKIDEVLLTVMRSPRTYTKEDIIEINCHGGFVPLKRVLELTLKQGSRLAEPGEFTKRAFLNGRLDLTQAEAVIEIIQSKTAQSEKIAIEQLSGNLRIRINALRAKLVNILTNIEAYIDFPEEEIEPESFNDIKRKIIDATKTIEGLSRTYDEGKFFKDGLKAAIVGRPNVGKSSLLNALLEKDRAIVTPIPGTTRDTLEEYINIGGLPVKVMDTAGIRESHDMAEKEGVKRSLQAIADCDLAVVVLDGSLPVIKEEDKGVINDTQDKKTVIVINKSDILHKDFCYPKDKDVIINVSSKTGAGISELKQAIFDMFINPKSGDASALAVESQNGVIITNIRHKTALDNAVYGLREALSCMDSSRPLEIVSMELRTAIDKLSELTGAVTTDEILKNIFDNFCVGK